MPCLNEAETLERCVRRAVETLAASGLAGEVLVADNGSTDGSQEIAERAGARVVPVPERGYGAALLGGIAAARGRYVVMGDADDSYDFGDVPAFVARLEEGHDLVMGSRFQGRIEPGAMPFLHRWLGNPVLSFLGRLFFRVPISDFHCGIRGFRKEAIDRIGLRTTGMEFASEMVVKATLFGLRIGEIPVTLRKDGRSRPPHLRTWRDGWRHLRFLLMYSPRWLYLWPGLLLVLLGTGLLAWLFPGPRHVGAATLDVHAMLGAGRHGPRRRRGADVRASSRRSSPSPRGSCPKTRASRAPSGSSPSRRGSRRAPLLLLAGAALCASVAADWAASVFNYLDYSVSMRKMIPGALLLVLGAHGAPRLVLPLDPRTEAAMSSSAGLGAVAAAHGTLVFARRVRVLSGALAPLLPPGLLADVGCGSGTVSAAIGDACAPDVAPEGFDVLLRPGCAIPARAFDGRRLPFRTAPPPPRSSSTSSTTRKTPSPCSPSALASRPGRRREGPPRPRPGDERILAFMDWVGEPPHGVVLPYRYFLTGLVGRRRRSGRPREERRAPVPGLYPFPFSALFGRDLHFVARLARPCTCPRTPRYEFPYTRRHRAQELLVGLRLLEPLEEQLHRLDRRERREDLAEDPDPVELALLDEELFLPRPDLLMSMAGKTRRSTSRRSRWISMLPVPLNSSKMTSSIREPVSMRAVAMIVSEPPSSMLRAAPKKRFGFWSALASTPPERTLPDGGHGRVVGAGEARDRVEEDDDVALVLDEALGLLDDHLGHLDVARRRLVEGRADDLALHRPLHVGDLLGPLVDEQDDERDLGVVRRDRVRDAPAGASSCRSAAGRR